MALVGDTLGQGKSELKYFKVNTLVVGSSDLVINGSMLNYGNCE